jgi:AcrR family transcriptional regulator
MVTRNGGPSAPSLDPRARRSKQALVAALLELVADRDLPQIAVADITKLAGVSRSTFYEHYTDVHDLAESACTVVIDELVIGTPMTDPMITASREPAENPLIPMFEHFAEHAPLYRSLLGPDGSARVINHLLDRMRIRAWLNRRLDSAADAAADTGDIPYDPDASLVAGVLVGTAIDWLRHGCPTSPEQMAAVVWPQLLAAASVNGWEPTFRPGT